MIKSTTHVLNTLLLILLSLSLKAQFIQEAGGIGGWHFASNNIDATKQSLSGAIWGLSYGLGKSGIGSNQYKEIYGTQKAMIYGNFIGLNNPDTFGYSFGILPTVFLPLKVKSKVHWMAKVSYGVNLNTKGFGKSTNFDNRAISSPINFGFDLGLEAAVPLNKQTLTLGTGLYHVSNGSTHMPNGGINLIYLKTAMGFYPLDRLNRQKPNYTLGNEDKHWNYLGYLFSGYCQYEYFENMKEYWVFGFNQQFTYKVNHLYSIGGGLDFFYDPTPALTMKSIDSKLYEVDESEKFTLAMGIAQRFTLGKLFLPLGIYHYIKPLNNLPDPIYIRFGLGYQFSKRWFCGSFFKGTINEKGQLKSNFMEWSLGYKL